MRSLAKRLKTFTGWPSEHLVKGESLAEAGFLWTGEGDKVHCEVCKTTFDDWKADHDPWVEHSLRYPPCPFVKKKKGSAFITKQQHIDADNECNGYTIMAMKIFCDAAGLEFNSRELFKDCLSYPDRVNKMLALLHKAGLKAAPSLAKCWELKDKREENQMKAQRSVKQLRGQKSQQRGKKQQKAGETDSSEEERDLSEKESEQSEQETEQNKQESKVKNRSCPRTMRKKPFRDWDIERFYSTPSGSDDDLNYSEVDSDEDIEKLRATINRACKESGDSEKERSSSPEWRSASSRPGRSQQDPMTFKNYIERLKTFDKWPASHSVKPRLLVKAGFVWTGEKDKVVCERCNGVWMDWRKTEDPWAAHATVYPSCEFVRIMMGADYINQQQRLAIKACGGYTIAKLKRYCAAAGLKYNHNELVKGCWTYADRVNKMLALLHKAGLKGEPTLAKCRELKNTRGEDKMEVEKSVKWRREQKSKRRGKKTEQSDQEKEQSDQEKKQSDQETDESDQETEQSKQKRKVKKGGNVQPAGRRRDWTRRISIPDMRTFCKTAGLEFDYKSLVKGCTTNQDRVDKMIGLLEEAGLKGIPTTSKCMAIKRKQDQRKKKSEENEKQRALRQQQRQQSHEQRNRIKEQMQNKREERPQGKYRRQQEKDQSKRVNEQEQKTQQRGRERKQSGQEKGQNGQQRKQSGKKKGQNGQEETQSGPEKEQSGQEKKQSGKEKGQNGQDKRQSEQEGERTGRKRQRSGQESNQESEDSEQSGQESQTEKETEFQPKKSRPGPKSNCLRRQSRDVVLREVGKFARRSNKPADKEFLRIIMAYLYVDKPQKRRAGLTVTVPAKRAKINCEKCGKDFTYAGSLTKHRKTCGKGEAAPQRESFNCRFCDKRYSSLTFLQMHVTGQHGNMEQDKNMSCEKCGEIFEDQSSLAKHRKACVKSSSSAKDISRFTCKHCNTHYSSEAFLKKHIENRHEGGNASKNLDVDNRKCEKCGKVFSFEVNLEEHKKNCRNDEVPDNTQSVCNRTKASSAGVEPARVHLWHPDKGYRDAGIFTSATESAQEQTQDTQPDENNDCRGAGTSKSRTNSAQEQMQETQRNEYSRSHDAKRNLSSTESAQKQTQDTQRDENNGDRDAGIYKTITDSVQEQTQDTQRDENNDDDNECRDTEENLSRTNSTQAQTLDTQRDENDGFRDRGINKSTTDSVQYQTQGTQRDENNGCRDTEESLTRTDSAQGHTQDTQRDANNECDDAGINKSTTDSAQNQTQETQRDENIKCHDAERHLSTNDSTQEQTQDAQRDENNGDRDADISMSTADCSQEPTQDTQCDENIECQDVERNLNTTDSTQKQTQDTERDDNSGFYDAGINKSTTDSVQEQTQDTKRDESNECRDTEENLTRTLSAQEQTQDTQRDENNRDAGINRSRTVSAQELIQDTQCPIKQDGVTNIAEAKKKPTLKKVISKLYEKL